MTVKKKLVEATLSEIKAWNVSIIELEACSFEIAIKFQSIKQTWKYRVLIYYTTGLQFGNLSRKFCSKKISHVHVTDILRELTRAIYFGKSDKRSHFEKSPNIVIETFNATLKEGCLKFVQILIKLSIQIRLIFVMESISMMI